MNKAFIQHLLKTSKSGRKSTLRKKGAGFIFDMDGVIVDTENAWELYGDSFLLKLFGKKIREKVGDTIGMTINEEYAKAVKYGFSMDKQRFIDLYDEKAKYVFSKATISPGVDLLAKVLTEMKFKIGLVSSSRGTWINYLLPRLSFGKNIEYIISINDRTDLKPKPSPDAYLEAIRKLGASPKTTIILEDSNRGITAAKASGAFTIAFTQNLVDGYKQIEGDAKANSMEEVIRITRDFLKLTP